MQKDTSNHSLNDPTLLKQKENARRAPGYGPKKNTGPFLAVNK